jgi:glycosyltransferase involved in cell wall biosynthesis
LAKATHKKVWASLDEFFPPEGELKVGRSFANHNFIRALWRYGTFDEYHFFLHSPSHQKLFEEKHSPYLNSLPVPPKVELFCRVDLTRMMKEGEYTVFHQSDHIRIFNTLSHFRNSHGSFPVTAFIHSLSYPSFHAKYLEMMLGGATSNDAIICSSASGKKVLTRMFEELTERCRLASPAVKLEVIPFGLEAEDLDRLDRKQCRQEQGFSDSETIGLCLGRFSEYDKMDLFPLLQALQKIYQPGLPWRLVLAGSVASVDYVRMMELWIRALGIREAVQIRTDLSEKEKFSLFKAADFFISPSDNLQETFGITLLEAMAAGLPLIVSDFDGYRDLAGPDFARRIPTRWGKLDLLAPEGYAPLLDEAMLHRFFAQSICVDINEMAKALKEFFSQPGLCAEMGGKARKKFEECYAAPVVIRQLEGLWSHLKTDYSLADARSGPNPLFPDFYRAFSHYCTEELTPATKVSKTAFAVNLLAIGSQYPLLADMRQIVDWKGVMEVILCSFEGKKVEEIIRLLGEQEGRTYYLILWMLKHGILEIVS